MAREFALRKTAADFRDRSGKIKQKRSQPVSSATRSDDTPANSKKPTAAVGREQVIAKAGDTIPIVFGKRVSDVGGVWVQPPLLKQGSFNFEGQFLYAISQGDMAGTPQTCRS